MILHLVSKNQVKDYIFYLNIAFYGCFKLVHELCIVAFGKESSGCFLLIKN